MVPRVADAADPDRGKGGKPDGNGGVPDPGTLPQERAVAFHISKHSPGTGMVIAAERCTGPAHAVVEDLDTFPVRRGKDPPAGALRDGGDGSIPGGRSSRFLFFNKDAAFPHQPHYPVLCRAPRYTGRFLDVGHGKKTAVLRELAHQAQVFPPVFKHACHSGRGCTGYRR